MITRTLNTFLQYRLEGIQTGDFQAYINYFEETWDAAKRGDEGETLQPVSHKDIQTITQIIADQFFNGRPCQRALLREELHKLMQFQDRSEENLNGIISLTLRLWLAMNFRDEGITSATQSIHWGDTSPLDAFVAQQFPAPRLHIEAGERMFDFVLPDNFTVVKLRHYAGIDIDWTTSLNEHLDWDHKNRVLKIFPLKSYMHGLRESKLAIIPNDVIDEYIKTMNFLFPTWDEKTQKYLKRKRQAFRLEGPVEYPGALYLSDFKFWRDRLSTLYAEFCSPPPSLTQLFNDRRNVLQWYTFWFAVLIVALTVIFGLISSITAFLQTRYTYRALLLAIEAAESARACPNTCRVP